MTGPEIYLFWTGVRELAPVFHIGIYLYKKDIFYLQVLNTEGAGIISPRRNGVSKIYVLQTLYPPTGGLNDQ